jgi:membrane protein DedA with SNARE-associated domain
MDSLVDLFLYFYGPTAYFMLFGILVLCGLGLPIPEDVILLAAGAVSYYGALNLYGAIVTALVGVLFGDTITFCLGAVYGRKLTKKWIFHKLLPDDRLNWVKGQFKRRGNKMIFAARFMPGARAPIFFSAGTFHLPYRVFIAYDGLAALISVPLVIGAVYHFGDEIDHVVRIVKRSEHGVVSVIFGFFLLMVAKWYVTHRRVSQT